MKLVYLLSVGKPYLVLRPLLTYHQMWLGGGVVFPAEIEHPLDELRKRLPNGIIASFGQCLQGGNNRSGFVGESQLDQLDAGTPRFGQGSNFFGRSLLQALATGNLPISLSDDNNTNFLRRIHGVFPFLKLFGVSVRTAEFHSR